MQGDATPILQACLNDGSVPALTLAAEIIDEGPRKMDQTVRISHSPEAAFSQTLGLQFFTGQFHF